MKNWNATSKNLREKGYIKYGKEIITNLLIETGTPKGKAKSMSNLYWYNAQRQAKKFVERINNSNLSEDFKKTYGSVDFVAFGLISGNETYSQWSNDKDLFFSDPQKAIDLSKTEQMAIEFNEDYIVDGKLIYKSPATLNNEYRQGKITREEWLQGLNDYTNNVMSYIARGYEGRNY